MKQFVILYSIDSVLDEVPTDTYTSSNGFYVRIKKPVQTGHVNFTYGVFKETSKQGTFVLHMSKQPPRSDTNNYRYKSEVNSDKTCYFTTCCHIFIDRLFY